MLGKVVITVSKKEKNLLNQLVQAITESIEILSIKVLIINESIEELSSSVRQLEQTISNK